MTPTVPPAPSPPPARLTSKVSTHQDSSEAINNRNYTAQNKW